MKTSSSASVVRPSPTGIPNFLLSSSLRLFCVRCVIITAVTSSAFAIYRRNIPGSVIFLITLVHHLGSAFGPTWFPLLTWMDLLLMMGEIVYNIYLLTVLMRNYRNLRWFPKRMVGGVFGVWVLAISLGTLLTLKVVQLIDARGSTFMKKVDIIRSRSSSTRKGGDVPKPPFWKYPVAVLFGRKLWERQLPGEASWIIILRGALAFLVIAALAVFAFFQIVIAPVSEMGLTPNAQFRSQRIPITFNSSTPVVWNLILVWQKRKNSADSLANAVSVQPLWGVVNTSAENEGPMGPPCQEFIPGWQDLPDNMRHSTVEVVIFTCPPRVPIPDDQKYSFHPLYYDRKDTRPNLLLSANFTNLMSPNQRPGDRADMIFDSLKVYLGLTNNTKDVIATTRPTPLLPGANLLGVANLIIRQRLRAPELSTLGLFDLYNTFMVADMAYTTLDPLTFDKKYGYNISANASTMRIACQDDPGEWMVVQDYRSHSVLEGISAIGGLGAFISALFVVWFGSSLMRTVYRTKPLSPFGVLHNLDNQQVILSEELHRKYPALRAELMALRENPGLLSFVFDTMLDVALIDKAMIAENEFRKDRGKDELIQIELQEPKDDDDSQPLISAPGGPVYSTPTTPSSATTMVDEETQSS